MRRGFRQFALPIALACTCQLSAPVHGVERASLEREIQLLELGEDLERRIPGAEFRIAVFRYEDPDGTGLADAAMAVISRYVLIRSGVRSIGVIRYEGGVAPGGESRLSYFDKVDRIAEAQEVALALWGVIRRDGGDLVIDSYAQVPAGSVVKYFERHVRLPEAMGGGLLRARLRPDRIHVQRLRVAAGEAGSILSAAEIHDQLRESPSDRADVVGEMPKDQTYYVRDRDGDWVDLVSGDLAGWVPVTEHCLDACGRLLHAAEFSGRLLAYMDSPSNSMVATGGLTTEALAVAEQIEALDGLERQSIRDIELESLEVADRWTGDSRRIGRDDRTGIERGQGVAPGGAAFANIRALAQLALALREASSGVPYDSVRLEPGKVAALAFELAQASQYDPKNVDVLENLALLFDIADDAERATLARSLAERAGAGR